MNPWPHEPGRKAAGGPRTRGDEPSISLATASKNTATPRTREETRDPMSYETSPRTGICGLRRRLQCEEGDAGAVLVAAEQAGMTQALQDIVGNWNAGDEERHAMLTTLVCDESGDYILETERDQESSNGERIRRRPARITFVVHGRYASGKPAVIAIPTSVAFANDDACFEYTDAIRPVVAAAPTTDEKVLETVHRAFFINDPEATTEAQAAERESFTATAQDAVKTAMVPEGTSDVMMTVQGTVRM